MYLDANNLYGWGMSQKLSVNGFKWVKKLSKFDERFIKKYDKNSDKRYILEVHIEHPKNLIFMKIFCSQLKEKKLKNARSLFVAYMIKKTMFFT